MKCGPDGNGYTFKIASALVKSMVPALKWGLLFLKVALATQGNPLPSPLLPFPSVVKTDSHSIATFYIIWIPCLLLSVDAACDSFYI